jgi:hypothetical protein
MPANRRLMDTPPEAATAETRRMLERSGALHAGRSGLGLLATLIFCGLGGEVAADPRASVECRRTRAASGGHCCKLSDLAEPDAHLPSAPVVRPAGRVATTRVYSSLRRSIHVYWTFVGTVSNDRLTFCFLWRPLPDCHLCEKSAHWQKGWTLFPVAVSRPISNECPTLMREI